jgi:hypothetical protein
MQEIIQGISLYSYLYLKLAKGQCFSSYYFLCFFLYKIGEQEGRTGSMGAGWGGGLVQIMYTHVIKCKNNTC